MYHCVGGVIINYAIYIENDERKISRLELRTPILGDEYHSVHITSESPCTVVQSTKKVCLPMIM